MVKTNLVVLQDFSKGTVIEAIQSNRKSLHAFSCSWPQVDVRDDDEVSWCITDLREPFFNCVYRTNIKREHVNTIIEDAMARAKSKNVHLWWFIGTNIRPANIEKYLKTHGFIPDEVSGMALDLQVMNEAVPGPENFEIRRVRDADGLRLWCRIAVTGFEMPEEVQGDWIKWYGNIGVGPDAPIQHYLGLIDGVPVATASLLPAGGVAGIYNVATIPAMRRQGVGFAITLQPLRDARDDGFRIAVLQATKKGHNIYRKIGFRDCCKLRSYIWISGPRILPDPA